jgi:hypothetical protein
LEAQLITILEKLCCFMLHEFISLKGRYHNDSGHMADKLALCDWSSESQSKLCIVRDHFKHYLGVS